MIWFVLVAVIFGADGERIGMERIASYASKEACERSLWFVEHSGEKMTDKRVKALCIMADAP